jgi:hypothetical protein
MSVISSDELRTRIEWARNNGKASREPGGGVRFEHEGKTYVIPAELLDTKEGSAARDVDLSGYVVRD